MDRNALDQLQNSTVFATDGDKIGSVGQVYLDDVTNEPTFVTVKTGLFGARETFVPLQQAQTTTDGITVPFEKSFVKDAPNVDADGSLTPEEEQRIYEYYSMEYSLRTTTAMCVVTTCAPTPAPPAWPAPRAWPAWPTAATRPSWTATAATWPIVTAAR